MKYYIASVGAAYLAQRYNGSLQTIASVKTLTESMLSFSVSSEDIRGGEGNQLFGKFFHDSKLEITLSDAMWDLNYIGLTIGNCIGQNVAVNGMRKQCVDNAPETVSLSSTPTNIGVACGIDKPLIWIRNLESDKDDIVCVEPQKNQQGFYTNIVDIPTNYIGKNLRLEYFVESPQSRALNIGGDFIPTEMVLVLSTILYAGSSGYYGDCKPAGYITIEIPRFQLDGTFDLSMAMNSSSLTQIHGCALAVDDEQNGESYLGQIVQIHTLSDASDGLVSIVIDGDTDYVGSVPILLGTYRDGHISVIEYWDYEITPDINLETGLMADIEYTITVGDLSIVFVPKDVSPHWVGNPVILKAQTASDETRLWIHGDGPESSLEIIGAPNIRLISRSTVFEVIHGPGGEQTYRIDEDHPFIIEAGDTTLIFYG